MKYLTKKVYYLSLSEKSKQNHPNLYRYLLGTDFGFFCDEGLNFLKSEGADIVSAADFHADLIDLFTQNERCLGILFRGSAKTTFGSQLYPIWHGLKGKKFEYLIGASETLARKNLEQVAEIVEKWEPLRYLYNRNHWTKLDIKFTNDTNIIAKGFGSTLRGGKNIYERPSLIVCDDVIGDKPIYPKRYYIAFFFGAVVFALRPGGQIVLIGTRFWRDDVLAECEKKPGYKKLIVPIRDVLTGKSNWSARWTEEKIEDEKLNQDPIEWSRNMLLRVIKPGGGMLAAKWLKQWNGKPKDPLNPNNYADVMFVDPSITTKEIKDRRDKGPDFMAITIMRYYYSVYKWVVLSVYRERCNWDRGLDLIKQYAHFSQYGARVIAIGVEANFYQTALCQQLINTTDLPIIPVYSHKDKAVRIMSMAIPLRNKQIEFASIPDEWRAEYLEFPDGDHDDQLDSFHGAYELSKMYSGRPGII